MGTFILKRKFYSIYDETDHLKRMKDSDILAEKERNESYAPVVGKAAAGAAAGATALGVANGMAGFTTKGSRLKSAARGMAKGMKFGALAGAGIGGAMALHQRSKKQDENDHFNNRLHYAQTQAKRRERADWKQNMTTRDGYSY